MAEWYFNFKRPLKKVVNIGKKRQTPEWHLRSTVFGVDGRSAKFFTCSSQG
jgi:hypothetical protein